MRSLRPLTVFVVAILTVEVTACADDQAAAVASASDSIRPVSVANQSVYSYSGNGYDQYRHQPDPGAPSSPSHGFRHFPLPMHMFTTWYRPKAATLTKGQRCAPQSFRPRGYGNLFAEPCDSFRMDYSPYVLNDGQSNYGPSYLYRQANLKCDCHDGQSCRHCR